MQLTEEQENAVQALVNFIIDPESKYFILKGRPGSGKSTILSELYPRMLSTIKLVAALNSTKELPTILTLATTRSACHVLSAILGVEVTTVHSALGLRPVSSSTSSKLAYDQGNKPKLHNTIVVIDEAFYIDSHVLNALLACIGENCKIIFVGDPEQCAPPKEDRSPIEDLNASVFELKKSRRFNDDIAIIVEHWRSTLYTQHFPIFNPQGQGVHMLSAVDYKQAIDDAYTKVTGHNVNKVLCWTNPNAQDYNDYINTLLKGTAEIVEGDVLVVNSFNKRYRLNTDDTVKVHKILKRGSVSNINGTFFTSTTGATLFYPDDRRNVSAVSAKARRDKDWALLEQLESIPDLRRAHASTVHKAQGNTFRNVFVDLSDIGKCSTPTDFSRMMIVASSRPTSKLIFGGSLPKHYGGR